MMNFLKKIFCRNTTLRAALDEAIESFESMKRTAIDQSRSHKYYLDENTKLRAEKADVYTLFHELSDRQLEFQNSIIEGEVERLNQQLMDPDSPERKEIDEEIRKKLDEITKEKEENES